MVEDTSNSRSMARAAGRASKARAAPLFLLLPRVQAVARSCPNSAAKFAHLTSLGSAFLEVDLGRPVPCGTPEHARYQDP